MAEFDIYLVDDNDNWLFLFSSILEKAGYKIKSFNESPVALEEIKRHPPKLLILDYMMPSLKGDDMMMKISELKIINLFNAIVLTEINLSEDQDFSFKSLGFSEVLSKSLKKEKLLEIVKSQLDDWHEEKKNVRTV
jgi:CheY-like chemotaxis protein